MRNGLLVVGVLLSAQVMAIDAPIMVSPSNEKGIALIESRCPTFNWSSVADAKTYELAVYPIDDQAQVAKGAPPILRSVLPASSNGWTPSLDQCLQRGSFYAWTIRANGDKASSEWAPVRVIEVSAGIDRAEFERAVQVVERYLKQREAGPASNESAGTPASSSTSTAPSSTASQASTRLLSLTKGSGNFTIDGAGNVVGTAFSGSGAGLTNVAAQTASSLAANGSNCTSGNAPLGVSATGAAENCFDVATQTELNAHTSSGDHDSRYLRLTGGTVSGIVNFNDNVNFASSRFVTVNGVLSFPCPFTTSGQLRRAGAWCIEPFINTTAATASDAILACHNKKMSLCPMDAILACDIGNVGSAGGATTSCGDRTDNSDGPILTSTLQGIAPGNSGSAFGDHLVFDGNGNVAKPASDIGGTAQYYCCLPAPTF